MPDNYRAVMQMLKPSLPQNDDGRINPMCAALVLSAMTASLDPTTVAAAVIDCHRRTGNLIDILPSLSELMRNPPTLSLPPWFKDDFGGWSDADD